MIRHSVNNNTRKGLVIFLCSNSNHLISLTPELPQILDVYSVVVLLKYYSLSLYWSSEVSSLIIVQAFVGASLNSIGSWEEKVESSSGEMWSQHFCPAKAKNGPFRLHVLRVSYSSCKVRDELIHLKIFVFLSLPCKGPWVDNFCEDTCSYICPRLGLIKPRQ